MLIELASDYGLNVRRTSNSKGGEYHSGCPACGEGVDRFVIWQELDRYWCRRCNVSGDGIQFCRDYFGMDYSAACVRVGKVSSHSHINKQIQHSVDFKPKSLPIPSRQWNNKANIFVQTVHKYLIKDPQLLNRDKNRGLNKCSIEKFQLGWNPTTTFEGREAWGISNSHCEVGSKWMCLPKGIVIPCYRDKTLIRVKVRRHDWHSNDKYPKYYMLPGGMSCPVIFGNTTLSIILVEAELDAMLVQQVAEDICCCIALGGVSMKPDPFVDNVLRKACTILYSLDFDNAGKDAFYFWKKTYSQLKPWPVPEGKSPGEAFIEHGINLRDWVLRGIEYNI